MKVLVLSVLMLAASSANASVDYYCEVTSGNGQDQILKIFKETVHVSRTKNDTYREGTIFIAQYDESYQPKRKNLVRYVGKERDSYDYRHAILHTDLLAGKAKGFMQIRGSEDGFWSIDYSCTRIK